MIQSLVEASSPLQPGTPPPSLGLPEGAVVLGTLRAAEHGEGYLVLVPAPAPAAPGARPSPVAPGPGSGIHLDNERRTAAVDGRRLDLTYLEFQLLAHLAAHPQRVHSRAGLLDAVWGLGFVGDGRTVDVHVARLRRKLGPKYRDRIVTVRRIGYKYLPPAR